MWAWQVCPECYIPQCVPRITSHVWHGAPRIWTRHCVPEEGASCHLPVFAEFCFCWMFLALCDGRTTQPVSSVLRSQRLGLFWCLSQYVPNVCLPGIVCLGFRAWSCARQRMSIWSATVVCPALFPDDASGVVHLAFSPAVGYRHLCMKTCPRIIFPAPVLSAVHLVCVPGV